MDYSRRLLISKLCLFVDFNKGARVIFFFSFLFTASAMLSIAQGIYRAPGPSRSIDNLRLYGVLSQTIVLCSNDGSDSEGTGAERECLEARARR